MLGSVNRGGIETLILDILNNHNIAPFDMICIHRKKGSYYDEYCKSGVSLYELVPKHIFDITYFLKLRKILKENSIDIVHAHTAIDACIAIIVTLFLKIGVVTTYHSYTVRPFLTYFALLFSKLNIFVSKYQREIHIQLYKTINSQKYEVVYNGMDIEKISSSDIIFFDFIQNGKKQGKIQMCMVGNFVRVREHLTVCRFLHQLKQKGCKFDFYFIGRKDENDITLYQDCVDYCLKNGLKENVHFLGGRGDVPIFLNQMDAAVYSTDMDTFGIALVEMIVAGIPTLVNDWPVMVEITQNGELANIYETKNEFDLLEKFECFLNNRVEYIQKAKQNGDIAKELYSIEIHVENLYQVYKKNIICQ